MGFLSLSLALFLSLSLSHTHTHTHTPALLIQKCVFGCSFSEPKLKADAFPWRGELNLFRSIVALSFEGEQQRRQNRYVHASQLLILHNDINSSQTLQNELLLQSFSRKRKNGTDERDKCLHPPLWKHADATHSLTVNRTMTRLIAISSIGGKQMSL